MSSDTEYYSSIKVDQYHTSSDGPDILLSKARGTRSSPTANLNGDELGKFMFYTYDGSRFSPVGAIRAKSVVSAPNYGSDLEFFTSTDASIDPSYFTPRLKIKADGDSEFSGTVSATGFETSGTVTANSATIRYDLSVEGDITYGGSISNSSDRRVKENFENINNAISIIDQINPLKYKKFSNIQKLGNSWEEYGFIAQEIKKVLPILVKQGNTSENLLSINYRGFIPILTKAIQEQQVIIENNKSEIQELKQVVEDLKQSFLELSNSLNNQ